MKLNTVVRITCVVTLTYGGFVQGAATKSPYGELPYVKNYDTNHNGKNEPEELRREVLEAFNPTWKDLDRNHDGKATDAEIDQYVYDRLGDLRDAALEKKEATGQPLTQDEIDTVTGTKPKEEDHTFGKSVLDRLGIYIRDTYDSDTTNEGAFAQAKGARISYTRDYLGEQDIWSARGAIIRPIQLPYTRKPVAGKMVLTKLDLTLSVAFDRVTGTGGKDQEELDSLVMRLGIDSIYQGGPVDLLLVNGNARYETDFGLAKKAVAGEVDVEPIKDSVGLGAAKAIIPGLINVRWRAYMHTEFGTQYDAGDAAAKEDGNFGRFGPFLEADILPVDLKSLTLYVKYAYLWGFYGSPSSAYHFETGLKYNLDEFGHFTLDLTYERGRVPIVEKEVEYLQLGLGVKF